MTGDSLVEREPPTGAIVADCGNELWRREPYGWTFELSPGEWDKGAGIPWRDLVRHYGPVKVERGA